MTSNAPSHAWSIWWACWFFGWFGSFLVAEIYALCTRWQNTLSAWVWSWEKFVPGQPVTSWAAFHFLFIGMLILVDVWLLGHFGWGAWRN